MKKSLLALAVLGAFAASASAQSSVTMYGRADAALGKAIGSTNKQLGNGSGSRLGMRGVEDLGGGTQAIFNIEHRYDIDEGNFKSNAARFWHARSVVGLQGGWGRITLGREYTPAFLMSQLAADPWGWDTVVGGYLGNTRSTAALFGGGLTPVRNDNSITYNFAAGGFSAGAQIAEGDGKAGRPFSIGLGYAGGPLTIGFGYEKRNQFSTNEKWATLNGAYAFGPAKVGLFYGKGTNEYNHDVKSAAVTAAVGLGGGELRAIYGRRGGAGQADPGGLSMQFGGLGYHYALSKRTTVYADVATDRRAASDKIGYDFGLKHNF